MQNWDTLSFGTKVLATLGSGIAVYFAGLFLGRDERTKTADSAIIFRKNIFALFGILFGTWLFFSFTG